MVKSENPRPITQNPQILERPVVSFFISKKYFEKLFLKIQKKFQIQNLKRKRLVVPHIFSYYVISFAYFSKVCSKLNEVHDYIKY